MLDLSDACLARNKQHVAALVDILEGADREVVENAVQAVAALPSIKVCEDGDELQGAVPPPDDAVTAERVETLRERLARARMLEAAGSYADGLALALKVRGEAKTLGYAPLQAEAALVEGGLLSASARASEAEVALAEALGLGIIARPARGGGGGGGAADLRAGGRARAARGGDGGRDGGGGADRASGMTTGRSRRCSRTTSGPCSTWRATMRRRSSTSSAR
jgi:hypothetical protein